MIKSSVSFSGCGFLGVYHIGVAACLKKYAPQVLQNKISGASAGSLAAAAVICDGSLGTMMAKFLHFVKEAHKRPLGAFCPTFDMDHLLRGAMEEVLPADAHIRCSGRLIVSVTRVSDGKNIQLSQFDTREDLACALLSSAFIPGFSGMLPYSVGGVRYIDGGFTDNQPMVDDNTITVSPFAGEGDICPKDNTPGVLMVSMGNTMVECSTRNLYRSTCVVFPPGANTLSQMCQQGFDDALEFLQRQDLITCQDCLRLETAISAGLTFRRRKRTASVLARSCSYLDGRYCETCQSEKQNVAFDKLPSTFGDVVKEAKAKAKDDLMLRLLRYKLIRIIFLLFLPITLPMNLAYVILFKFNTFTPTYGGVVELVTAVINHLKSILDAFLYIEPSHRQYHRLSTKRIKNRDSKPIPHTDKHIKFHDKYENIISDKLETSSISDLPLQCASQTRPLRSSLRRTARRQTQESFSEHSSVTFYSQPEEMSGPDVISLPGASPQKVVLGEGSTQEAVMAYYLTDQDSNVVFTSGTISGGGLHIGGGEIG
ncbi:unnamed protein product [Meganyctiphanes norvegica]|uniref:PNPLA domain-containing protein n=1 Tax=Meganyctiphanes norvegica TaxID=48144 RepID=A0AAV2RDR8_MEGNR